MTHTLNEGDDDLRIRLLRIDPAPAELAVDPVTSPRARQLLERAMDTIDQATPLAEADIRRNRFRQTAIAAAAAVILAVAVVITLTTGGHKSTHTPTSVALSAPAGSGPSMGSCIMFDVKYLRDMPVALAGTVTAADDTGVTLTVDHWFKGGDADQVTIANAAGQTSTAEDGIRFEVGKRYLLTATNGTINGCGYSGLATPDLERYFNEAFPS